MQEDFTPQQEPIRITRRSFLEKSLIYAAGATLLANPRRISHISNELKENQSSGISILRYEIGRLIGITTITCTVAQHKIKTKKKERTEILQDGFIVRKKSIKQKLTSILFGIFAGYTALSLTTIPALRSIGKNVTEKASTEMFDTWVTRIDSLPRKQTYLEYELSDNYNYITAILEDILSLGIDPITMFSNIGKTKDISKKGKSILSRYREQDHPPILCDQDLISLIAGNLSLSVNSIFPSEELSNRDKNALLLTPGFCVDLPNEKIIPILEKASISSFDLAKIIFGIIWAISCLGLGIKIAHEEVMEEKTRPFLNRMRSKIFGAWLLTQKPTIE